MIRITDPTPVPEGGWWQVYLQVDDRDADRLPLVDAILSDLFPECSLAVDQTSADRHTGVWLIELPEWAREALTQDGRLLLDNDGWVLEAEMP